MCKAQFDLRKSVNTLQQTPVLHIKDLAVEAIANFENEIVDYLQLGDMQTQGASIAAGRR